MFHEPVMMAEVLHYLQPRDGDVIIDCTLGTGGHAEEVLKRIGPTGILLGIDRDEEILHLAARRLSAFATVKIFEGNYTALKAIMEQAGVSAADGLLFDLGACSLHLDQPERGFSFSCDGPLDMRMNKGQRMRAEDIINRYSEKALRNLLEQYGEEPRAGRIARAVVRARKRKSIQRTAELAELIASVAPQKHRRVHAATRVFQALRIAVNQELECLEEALPHAKAALKTGGRLVAISFHSLEDRIVKNFLRREQEQGSMTLLTKKCLKPSEEERERNPRSRSARLRAGMKGAA